MSASMRQSDYARHLKEWRTRRRMSQHDLAIAADVSGRHVSFLETGRSQPSKSMVLHLADVLEVPKVARNTMLKAAGLAQIYGSRSLDAEDLTPVREAINWMLDRHDPYPAVAMDRHWNILQLNGVATRLFAPFQVVEGHNLLDAMLGNDTLRQSIENFPEVADHLHQRVTLESSHFGGDAVLDAFAKRLDKHVPPDRHTSLGTLPAFATTKVVIGDQRLTLLTTLSQFGSADDIALADIRIELMFPADEETKAILTAIGQDASAQP